MIAPKKYKKAVFELNNGVKIEGEDVEVYEIPGYPGYSVKQKDKKAIHVKKIISHS